MYYVRWWTFVVLLVLVAHKSVDGAMSMEQMEKAATAMRNSCIQKIGADPELVAGIRRGEFPDDPKTKCYTACIMKKLRTFKNGAIDVSMVEKQIDAMMPAEFNERLKFSARKCGAAASGEDACDITYSYLKCGYETDPEIFFFP